MTLNQNQLDSGSRFVDLCRSPEGPPYPCLRHNHRWHCCYQRGTVPKMHLSVVPGFATKLGTASHSVAGLLYRPSCCHRTTRVRALPAPVLGRALVDPELLSVLLVFPGSDVVDLFRAALMPRLLSVRYRELLVTLRLRTLSFPSTPHAIAPRRP